LFFLYSHTKIRKINKNYFETECNILTHVIVKYKFLILILCLILLTALLWLLMLRNNMGKIPSRGVFVMETLEYVSGKKMEMAYE